ncbi:MAG TPA: bifunctional protein-serine/threonine kinase/phosphatase [Steroidobacteraceae bacterium]|nr:bifunctional protein-serine/threonine kinase/phosphatase [Steroidobacteraceae bacterium]
MPGQLKISLGQYSDKGRKESNQDFHGACIPGEPQLAEKGIAIALADGISSSNVSQVASQSAVRVFLEDYYCTSPAWSVKKSAQAVLMAVNSWLYAQTQQSPYRFEKDRGYVCTLSALVLKSNTAHLFHAGDARIYRLRDGLLEQLTNDHRVWVSSEQSYLSRALGIHSHLDIDYQALRLEQGDVFVFATDGVHEFANSRFMINAVKDHGGDLDAAARLIANEAFERGSQDNLTTVIVRVDTLPGQSAGEVHRQLTELPFPPDLAPRMVFDGFTIVRELHASSRSHVYLATHGETAAPVVIKTLATEMRADAGHLDRFLMEDWVAQRISNAHVVKAAARGYKRNYLYTVTEFVDGQTLHQWLIDHPRPTVEAVRGIIEQIANGLLAFHRLEMLHQDLRPQNVMIDATGTVKLIDFGSTRVAGISEIDSPIERSEMLGTLQYTAPEYFLGESGTARSDLFSLGVIAYQMLSGRLPFGAEVPKARTRAAQRQLKYQSVLDDEREIPAWIDEVLRKATHPDPSRRYEELSEFVYDLRHPTERYLSRKRAPLLERKPVAFWQGVSMILAVAVVILLLS